MHTLVYIPKTHYPSYYQEFLQPKLIHWHSYYTRNNTRRIMEEIELNLEFMRQDINQLNGKLDRLMNALKELANREQNPQPQAVENQTESGLTQPRPTQASVAQENGTPVIQENDDIAAGFPMPQGTTENTLLVYHSSDPSSPQWEHTKPSIDARPPEVGGMKKLEGRFLL